MQTIIDLMCGLQFILNIKMVHWRIIYIKKKEEELLLEVEKFITIISRINLIGSWFASLYS